MWNFRKHIYTMPCCLIMPHCVSKSSLKGTLTFALNWYLLLNPSVETSHSEPHGRRRGARMHHYTITESMMDRQTCLPLGSWQKELTEIHPYLWSCSVWPKAVNRGTDRPSTWQASAGKFMLEVRREGSNTDMKIFLYQGHKMIIKNVLTITSMQYIIKEENIAENLLHDYAAVIFWDALHSKYWVPVSALISCWVIDR